MALRKSPLAHSIDASTLYRWIEIIKPFLGQKKGATKAEVLSRAVEHGESKDAAAQMTQLGDDLLHSVLEESKAERRRIQQEAEGLRELPMIPMR